MYNFDKKVDRAGTASVKFDLREEIFGNPDVLPMWVADMDFETPECIRKAVMERATHPVYGYSIMTDGYFEAFKGWLKRRHNREIQKEWIVFSPGIVTAINAAVLSFTEPDDSVVVQPPVYFPFFDSVKNNGRKLLYNQLIYSGNTYKIDFDDLEQKAKEAKLMLLSSPHNPVSRCWNLDELKRIGEICLENDVIILSDEIHADLVLPGYKHIPLTSVLPELEEITITCMAPSKTFNVAGLFTSQIIIKNEVLREKFKKTMDTFHLIHGNIFGMIASEAGYTHGDAWLDALMQYIKENFELVDRFFKNELPVFTLVKPEATFLAWIDYTKTGLSQKEIEKKLIESAQLGLNPGRIFGPGGSGFMRMNLGTPRSNVLEALHRLKKVF
jgi:cystathionine beta-lyase